MPVVLPGLSPYIGRLGGSITSHYKSKFIIYRANLIAFEFAWSRKEPHHESD